MDGKASSHQLVEHNLPGQGANARGLQALGAGFVLLSTSRVYSIPPLANLALEYGEAFGFPVRINRCGVLAGAGQFGKADQGIFTFWLHSWREKRPLQYIGFDGQGHQVRDCLHPRDLAALLALQLQAGDDRSKPRLANVSGGAHSAHSLQQLSTWCAERWGPNPVSSNPAPRPYDLPWVVLDHAQASSSWGWTPQLSTPTILGEIATFAEENANWIALSA